jgi:hypothetical protein
MMGKTFMDEMEDTHRIWVFPFASMVLRYEKMLDKRQRIKYRHGREARFVAPCICLRSVPILFAFSNFVCIHNGPIHTNRHDSLQCPSAERCTTVSDTPHHSWNEGSCRFYQHSKSEGASRRISRGLDGSPEAAAAAAVARMRERYYETRIENDGGWREVVPGSEE